ncbi:MAG TPA: enoyl-CoA hydratase-related protein [Solirubrobacterales bacterium]|jgi:crotonobetainyl-CoA hydratase|nr:enoyl-CoA hydratase-related protein [Solirubrobacterales bacterium]
MEGLRIERRGATLELTIDRPKANAIDSATSAAMGEAFMAFRDDPELRVAIVTGAGERFFSAGWDLKAYAAGDPADQKAFGPGGLAGLTELFDLDKPVIAAVNGYAAGGGFELALACDMVVAVPQARFSLPEVKLGLVADSGGILRLPRRMPRALAMELLLTGKPIDAVEAARWGLVNRVVEREALLETARALAAEIEATAPLATRAVMAIVAATEQMTVERGFSQLRDGSIPAYDRAMASADAEEGPRAFAEGREPVWRGE